MKSQIFDMSSRVKPTQSQKINVEKTFIEHYSNVALLTLNRSLRNLMILPERRRKRKFDV